MDLIREAKDDKIVVTRTKKLPRLDTDTVK